MTHNPFIERPLSDAEVQERRMMLEHFLDEQDDLTGAVAEKKREIKETNVAIERVTARVRQLRHEIRNRMVLDAAPAAPPPQQSLPGTEAFVVTTKDGSLRATVTPTPAAPADPYALFWERYPAAKDPGTLYHDLRKLLGPERFNRMPSYCPWHQDSGIFGAVAHWLRIERAHRDSEADAKAGKPAEGGLTIPARVPMPVKLAEFIGAEMPGDELPGAALPKPKRQRKLTNRQQGK